MTRTASPNITGKPLKGRTRRTDRAGKTRTTLPEMRTALQGTRAVKSMRVNDNYNFFAVIDESEHSETIRTQILLSR